MFPSLITYQLTPDSRAWDGACGQVVLFWKVISGNRGRGRGEQPFVALLLLGHGCCGGFFMVITGMEAPREAPLSSGLPTYFFQSWCILETLGAQWSLTIQQCLSLLAGSLPGRLQSNLVEPFYLIPGGSGAACLRTSTSSPTHFRLRWWKAYTP